MAISDELPVAGVGVSGATIAAAILTRFRAGADVCDCQLCRERDDRDTYRRLALAFALGR